MQKRSKVLIGVAVAVVVLVVAGLVGSRLYGNWVNSNADDVPTLTPSSESASADGDDADAATGDPGGDPAALSGEYTVAEGSFAGYRVDEVLNGQDVTVTGRTEDVSGAVTLVDGELTDGSIEVDLTTVATDESSRDEYFRSEAIDTSQFPTATFELTEPVAVVADGSDVELVGDLTINGVTNPATIAAQVGTSGEGLQVVGTAPITFADFDVEAPNLGFVTVEDAGSIEFSLELTAG